MGLDSCVISFCKLCTAVKAANLHHGSYFHHNMLFFLPPGLPNCIHQVLDCTKYVKNCIATALHTPAIFHWQLCHLFSNAKTSDNKSQNFIFIIGFMEPFIIIKLSIHVCEDDSNHSRHFKWKIVLYRKISFYKTGKKARHFKMK